MAFCTEIEETAEGEEKEEQSQEDQQHEGGIARRHLAVGPAPAVRTDAGDVPRFRVVDTVPVRVAHIAE